MDLKKLHSPFPVDRIHWRIGATSGDKSKGIALAYIDARDAMERLDEVCGPENWQRRYPWSEGNKLCCEVGIRINNEWVWKADGAGDTDVEASKGAFSDAFKRACVNWGIAQYLYDLPNTWVAIDPQGRSYGIAKETKAELSRKLASWQEQRFGGGKKEIVGQDEKERIAGLFNALMDKDAAFVTGYWDSLDTVTQKAAWSMASPDQRREIRAMLDAGRQT